jgi:hypothetical protein
LIDGGTSKTSGQETNLLQEADASLTLKSRTAPKLLLR